MSSLRTLKSLDYDPNHRTLKLCYSDGSGALFRSIPHFIHANMLRCNDINAFVQKYLEYDLHFQKMTIE